MKRLLLLLATLIAVAGSITVSPSAKPHWKKSTRPGS